MGKNIIFSIFGVVIFALLIGGIIIAIYSINKTSGGVAQAVTLPGGARQIGTTESKYASSFPCDEEYCVVSGQLLCNVGKTVTIDTEVCCQWETGGSCCLVDGGTKRCANRIFCIGGKTTRVDYTCNWKFCPSTDPNFPYCSKEETQTSAWTKTTDEVLISKGSTVTFRPTDKDNNPILQDNFLMYINRYRIMCANECKSTDLYCTPKTNICPSGTTLYSDNRWCSTLDGRQHSGGESNVCRSSMWDVDCYTIINDNSYYKKCDGTDSNGCKIFKTEAKSPSGQVCKPFSGSIGQTGVGSLVCDANSCQPQGYKKMYSTTQYKQCTVDSNGCTSYGTPISCPSGLLFDENAQKCVCPTPECDPVFSSGCKSETERWVCEEKIIGTERCLVKSASQTRTGRICKIIDNDNSVLACAVEECNSVNQKKCIPTTNKYYSCILNTASDCYQLSTIPNSCASDETCNIVDGKNDYCSKCSDGNICTTDNFVNGQCVFTPIANCCEITSQCDDLEPSTTDKCEANNQCSHTKIPDYCSSNAQCTSPKTCSNNKCVCPTTGDYCSKADYDFEKTICKDNDVWKCSLDVSGCYNYKFSSECQSEEICTN